MPQCQNQPQEWTPGELEQMKERVLELADQLIISLPPTVKLGLKVYLPHLDLSNIDDKQFLDGLQKAEDMISFIKYGHQVGDEACTSDEMNTSL